MTALRTLFFAASRADIGTPYTASGGCSLTRTSPAPTGLLLLAAALLLAWRIRATAAKSRRRANPRTLDP